MHDEKTPFESQDFPASEAPPTEAGDFVPVTPPEGWPTVIGILAIIFGALGAIGAGCGAAALVAAPAFVNVIPEGPERDQLQQQLKQSMSHVPLQVGVQLIEFVLAIVLIVGGVQLLKRSRAAAKTLTIYAVGDLISNTLVLIVGIMASSAQAKMMSENPEMQQQMPQGMQGFMRAAGVFGAVLEWIFTAIWPVFLLLWFRRTKIKDSIATWGGTHSDDAPMPSR